MPQAHIPGSWQPASLAVTWRHQLSATWASCLGCSQLAPCSPQGKSFKKEQECTPQAGSCSLCVPSVGNKVLSRLPYSPHEKGLTLNAACVPEEEMTQVSKHQELEVTEALLEAAYPRVLIILIVEETEV